jgi:hypothetical protein
LIVEQAEERAEVAEAAAAEARRQKREQERLSEMAAEAGMKLAPADGDEEDAAGSDAAADESYEALAETDEQSADEGLADVIDEVLESDGGASDTSHESSESAK